MSKSPEQVEILAPEVVQQAASRMSALVRCGTSLDRLNWVLGSILYENSLIGQLDEEVYQGMPCRD